MMRLLGQKTGTCFQRCLGLDGFNTMSEGGRYFALSFAIPADAPGVSYVFRRQTNETRRLDGVPARLP